MQLFEGEYQRSPLPPHRLGQVEYLQQGPRLPQEITPHDPDRLSHPGLNEPQIVRPAEGRLMSQPCGDVTLVPP